MSDLKRLKKHLHVLAPSESRRSHLLLFIMHPKHCGLRGDDAERGGREGGIGVKTFRCRNFS